MRCRLISAKIGKKLVCETDAPGAMPGHRGFYATISKYVGFVPDIDPETCRLVQFCRAQLLFLPCPVHISVGIYAQGPFAPVPAKPCAIALVLRTAIRKPVQFIDIILIFWDVGRVDATAVEQCLKAH